MAASRSDTRSARSARFTYRFTRGFQEGTSMLPPFIIEQIRRREEQERVRHEQPQLEIPLERPVPRSPQPVDDGGDRGVVIIEL
jgi:hypothetical protein